MQTIEAAIGAVVDAKMAAWMERFETLLKEREKLPEPKPERVVAGRQELYNAKEAAKILGCSGATVRKMIRTGQLLSMTVGGSTIYRIPRSELERMVSEKEATG